MADRNTDLDQRPSPDALLAQVKREEKAGEGRLTIFVGAAPGVGKTYEMLETARARRKEGEDVLIGVVETHGRKETEALLDGLEILPRKPIVYDNHVLPELDIDAALRRRPGLILVDELAHTNAPGSRHAKRYEDVEELLDAGIDVYTTLNIQHIESLNDVVAQITRVRVREIVPDAIVDRADAIKLVDLTPEELIERLEEGKVYVPAQAERALRHYFSPANLTALRELALRRTAERVDVQLLEQMRARAIPGPWPAGERIIVCVNEDPRSAGLVRYAKRLADRLHAPWTALSIETRRTLQLGEAERGRIADALRLAERLDGEAVTIPAKADRLADDIIGYAQKNNVTHVIAGKSSRSRWFEILHGSVVHDLVRHGGNISIQIIGGEAEQPPARAVAAPEARPIEPGPYAVALAAVGGALAVGLAIKPALGIENVDLIFLTAIVGVAARYGLWPSLAATVAASLCYNFYFLPPLYKFTIADPTNVLAFALFTVLALVVSNLAGRARLQTVTALQRARSVESLYAFSRKLARAGTMDDVIWATARQIAEMLRVRVVLLLPGDGDSAISVRGGFPPEDRLDEADFAAATWAWEQGRPAGRDSDTLPGADWLFVPMRTGRGAIGILGVRRDEPGPLLGAGQRRLLDALADQGALAIERVYLVDDIERVERAAETDRLRSALLTSISHDLKTPLAAVRGAAEALRDLPASSDEATKAELLATIIDEAERLNRFIANLLDMTRLEAGAVTPKIAPQDVGEMVGGALDRAAQILSKHRVVSTIPSDLPLVAVDPVFFEQALFNVLDNAAKYSPVGATVSVRAWPENDVVKIQVLDEGEGIPPSDLERIFDKFHRVHKGDQVRAGTGLGLSIARGFMEAMHGSVVAANRTDRSGAMFTFTAPVAQLGVGAGRAA
jgi:two-component system sensor histidine kinase KdpD